MAMARGEDPVSRGEDPPRVCGRHVRDTRHPAGLRRAGAGKGTGAHVPAAADGALGGAWASARSRGARSPLTFSSRGHLLR